MTTSDETKKIRNTSFGWLLQRITGQLDQAMEAHLSAHDLSVQQFAVLMTVLENEGLSQTDIGKQFRAPAYTISRTIDHLEKGGFLERKAHPTSRRTHTIFTTAKSRALSKDLFAIVEQVNAELTASLSQEETTQFGQILQKLHLNFAKAR